MKRLAWAPYRRSFLKGLVALAAPAIIKPASAWIHGTPNGGGSGYVAGAVHFDGTQFLEIASLTSMDNGFLSLVGWFKFTGPPYVVWVTDRDNNFNNEVTLQTGYMHFDIEALTSPRLSVDSDGPPEIDLDDGVWHSIVATLKLDESAGSRIAVIYVDRVSVAHIVVDVGGPFNCLTNGLQQTFFFDGGNPYIGDVADFRLLPGISLLTGSDIASGTLDLFVTAGNKPVDPAVANAALGTVGPVLFSGDASTFATNQGTGGAFTLTGTLTNASTSPSD